MTESTQHVPKHLVEYEARIAGPRSQAYTVTCREGVAQELLAMKVRVGEMMRQRMQEVQDRILADYENLSPKRDELLAEAYKAAWSDALNLIEVWHTLFGGGMGDQRLCVDGALSIGFANQVIDGAVIFHPKRTADNPDLIHGDWSAHS